MNHLLVTKLIPPAATILVSGECVDAYRVSRTFVGVAVQEGRLLDSSIPDSAELGDRGDERIAASPGIDRKPT